MAKMAELSARGVTDLHSYLIGKKDERDNILKVLERELNTAAYMEDADMVEIVTALMQVLTAFPVEVEEP